MTAFTPDDPIDNKGRRVPAGKAASKTDGRANNTSGSSRSSVQTSPVQNERQRKASNPGQARKQGSLGPAKHARMVRSRGLSDESIREFLPRGYCLKTTQQKAFAGTVRELLSDVPRGEVFLDRLKKGLDYRLLSHPSIVSNDNCTWALIVKMVELGIKIGQEKSNVVRIGSRLWNNHETRAQYVRFRSLLSSKDPHPLDDP